MDVTAASGIPQSIPAGVASTPRVAPAARPAFAEVARDAASGAVGVDTAQDPMAPPGASAAHGAQSDPHDAPGDPPSGPPPPPQPGGSLLKFDVASADVLARFSIEEGTKRVSVTMFQRDTGEVLREIPPRSVLDVMAALSGRGLSVDTSS